MELISPEGFDFFTPQGYDKIFREGRKVLMNILDIEAPMIAAVNGPVRLHSEYILLADIVLATPATVFPGQAAFRVRYRAGRWRQPAMAGSDRRYPRSLLHPHSSGA